SRPCSLPRPNPPALPTRRSSDLQTCRPVCAPNFETGNSSDSTSARSAWNVSPTACSSVRGVLSSDIRSRKPGIICLRRELPELRSEEHTSELQSRVDLVCRLLLE